MIESTFIKSAALTVGFDDCGIARATRLDDSEFPLERWLAEGYHADMHYMERNAEMRRDPRLLVPDARSVISLVVAYRPDRQTEGACRTAQYAYGEDYHERLKRMMYSLIAIIKERYADFLARPFVDTAPISDRHWAVRAGLGSIGRNTLFFHRRYGSYCHLCELVTTSEIDCYDMPEVKPPLCGECNRCVDACPNHAIVCLPDGAYVVDARRCTSYNTIENRATELPPQLDTRGYIFGCDICQLVCPRNANAAVALYLDDDRKAQLEGLPDMDEPSFRKFRKHTPLDRINYQQLQRNIEHQKNEGSRSGK